MRSARRPPKSALPRVPSPGSALTPVATLRDRLLAALVPVAAETLAPSDAVGAVLAADLVAPRDEPPTAIALLRGRAVASVETIGASPYAPVDLVTTRPVEPGAPVEAPCDAVLPADAISEVGGAIRVQEAVAPGANLLGRGRCAVAGTPLASAGSRLDPAVAVLSEACGITTVAVRRVRVLVRHDGSRTGIAGARVLASFLVAGPVRVAIAPVDDADPPEADVVLVLGRGDLSAADPALDHLATHGRLDGGGLALVACEAVAWGEIAGRPALVLPARPEEMAIAVPTLVTPLLRRLAGEAAPAAAGRGRLTRKIVSQIGFTELAFLARTASGELEPLAVGRPPWAVIARAEAWVELGPECEGHADGAVIAVSAMPFAPFGSIGVST